MDGASGETPRNLDLGDALRHPISIDQSGHTGKKKGRREGPKTAPPKEDQPS